MSCRTVRYVLCSVKFRQVLPDPAAKKIASQICRWGCWNPLLKCYVLSYICRTQLLSNCPTAGVWSHFWWGGKEDWWPGEKSGVEQSWLTLSYVGKIKQTRLCWCYRADLSFTHIHLDPLLVSLSLLWFLSCEAWGTNFSEQKHLRNIKSYQLYALIEE